jgi:hypothetical protein
MQNEHRGRSGGRGGGNRSLMTPCGALTRNGRPCKGLVRLGSDYCPAHEPGRADARRRAASKAARSKPGGEITALKDQLRTLADDVLAQRVQPKTGAVVTQVANVYARLLELERKYKEHEEFEARIVALEEEVSRKWESQNESRRG